MENNFVNVKVPADTIKEIKEKYGMAHLPTDGTLTWGELYLARVFGMALKDPVIQIMLQAAKERGETPESILNVNRWGLN